MSSTTQLERWAKKHASDLYRHANFLGVFAAEELPDPAVAALDASAAALVVNYDASDQPDSNWYSALWTTREVLWFDSYSLSPDVPDLLVGHPTGFRRWLSDLCRDLGLAEYSWNTADLQSPGETTCGHWALLFLQNGPRSRGQRPSGEVARAAYLDIFGCVKALILVSYIVKISAINKHRHHLAMLAHGKPDNGNGSFETHPTLFTMPLIRLRAWS